MKIDTNDFLTPEQAMAEIGCSRRALYRAMKRAVEDGNVIKATLLGREFITRAAVPVIAKYYFPWGSEERSAAAKAWGQKGGLTKAANRVKQSRKRSS